MHSLSIGIWFTGIKYTILNGGNCLIGGRAWGIEFGNWEFDIDGADLVRASIFGEAWHRAQAGEIGGHGKWQVVHSGVSGKQW